MSVQVLSLWALAAVAQEAPSEPEEVEAPVAEVIEAPDDEWRYDNGRPTGIPLYRAGMQTGFFGGIALVGGIALTVNGSSCPSGDPAACDASLGFGVLGILGGIVAMEVGAPLALAGAGLERERVMFLSNQRVGDAGLAIGWSFYGAQLLLSPLVLPGAYVGAAVQHGTNRRRAEELLGGGGLAVRWAPVPARRARTAPVRD